MIEARPADSADQADLSRLLHAAIDEKRPQRGGNIWSRLEAPDEPVGPAITKAIDSPDEAMIAGSIDGAVLGFCAIRKVLLHDGDTIADLHLLYVQPDARGVGLGEKLMSEALAWAEAHGCVGIDSTALPGDRQTKNFFESFGLVARQLTVHRSLRD